MRITRAVSEPGQGDQSWSDRWEGPDDGLIACWERGREMSREKPDLAALARTEALLILPWKGGVDKPTKLGHKYGSLYYLAMWQGLRGDALDISMTDEVTLKCARTGMSITYTPQHTKYSEP